MHSILDRAQRRLDAMRLLDHGFSFDEATQGCLDDPGLLLSIFAYRRKVKDCRSVPHEAGLPEDEAVSIKEPAMPAKIRSLLSREGNLLLAEGVDLYCLYDLHESYGASWSSANRAIMFRFVGEGLSGPVRAEFVEGIPRAMPQ